MGLFFYQLQVIEMVTLLNNIILMDIIGHQQVGIVTGRMACISEMEHLVRKMLISDIMADRFALFVL